MNDPLNNVGGRQNIGDGNVNIEELIEPKPVVKAYQNATFVVTIKGDGSIQVNIKDGSDFQNVYPLTSGKYSASGKDEFQK